MRERTTARQTIVTFIFHYIPHTYGTRKVRMRGTSIPKVEPHSVEMVLFFQIDVECVRNFPHACPWLYFAYNRRALAH